MRERKSVRPAARPVIGRDIRYELNQCGRHQRHAGLLDRVDVGVDR